MEGLTSSYLIHSTVLFGQAFPCAACTLRSILTALVAESKKKFLLIWIYKPIPVQVICRFLPTLNFHAALRLRGWDSANNVSQFLLSASFLSASMNRRHQRNIRRQQEGRKEFLPLTLLVISSLQQLGKVALASSFFLNSQHSIHCVPQRNQQLPGHIPSVIGANHCSASCYLLGQPESGQPNLKSLHPSWRSSPYSLENQVYRVSSCELLCFYSSHLFASVDHAYGKSSLG